MKNIRSFLLTFTFATTIITPLGAMEPKRMDVEATEAERNITTLLHVYTALLNKLPQELVHYIFSLHLISHLQDLQASHDKPKALVIAINKMQKKCGSFLSVEILKKSLVHAGISLFDIKYHTGWTTLHEAANHDYTEIVKVLLATAGDNAWKLICIKDSCGCTAWLYAVCHGYTEIVKILLATAGDNAWKLICMKGENGWTALHCVAYFKQTKQTEIVKIFLTAAGYKAWELICMGDSNNKTALDFANNEIKQIMEQYRPDNQ